MRHVLPLPVPVDLPVANAEARFPVHRVYGVLRNHDVRCGRADEAGVAGCRPPAFYWKPADAVRALEAGQTGDVPCPGPCQSLYFEVGLVVAIGRGGRCIRAQDATGHVYGYAVGLDMSRYAPADAVDMSGRRWHQGSNFDMPTYVGPIVAAADAPGHAQARLWLQVNGEQQQCSSTAGLVWGVGQIIEYLSADRELCAGDLIWTGTPAGAGMAGAGERVAAGIDGIGCLALRVANRAEP